MMFTARLFSRNCGQVSENDSQLIKKLAYKCTQILQSTKLDILELGGTNFSGSQLGQKMNLVHSRTKRFAKTCNYWFLEINWRKYHH